MTDPSANSSALITVTSTSTAGTSITSNATSFEWQEFRKSLATVAATSVSPEAIQSGLLDVSPAVAPWLADVQRRLNASIGTPVETGQRTGAWLKSDVVSTANRLFEVSSTLFPSAPHLYGSRDGDLVAEFTNQVGSMTMVVTKDSALAFAVVGSKTFQKTLSLDAMVSTTVARELSEITRRLSTDSHAQVDTGR
jgi:hypothetical protein